MNDNTLKPTLVCLINAAAYSRAYFEQLTPYLELHGYEVHYALDSHLPDVLYAGGKTLSNARYFTDYMQENTAKGRKTRSTNRYTWMPLFSDFDRFLTMDIRPPLIGGEPLQYADIPDLLDDFFTDITSKLRPVAFLYEPVSNSFASIAYEVSKRFGIPFCSLSPSRLPGRIELSLTGGQEVHLELASLLTKVQKGIVSEESLAVASDYIASIDSKTPDYMRTNGLDRIGLARKYFNVGKVTHFLRGIKYRIQYAKDCSISYQYGNPIKISLALFKRSLWRRLRIRRVLPCYTQPVKEEKYLLYPLHFHPEASTSILAPDFIEELAVIKSIAFRLPTTHKLYVKEHPSAVALQSIGFYKQITAMPNVRLIGPNYPTKTLIRHSEGVICVTSTVGFEAAVLNKPVIILGNVFYAYFPNVKRISDYSQLALAFQWLENYRIVSEADILNATAAYVEFGFPGKFDFKVSLNDPKALTSVADLVALRLKQNFKISNV
ncbi:MAG: hypothetical protein IPN42_19405 [Methylococcaceae bacterium]|nr:hypothetical protein [Methylococcaceae bacterium]